MDLQNLFSDKIDEGAFERVTFEKGEYVAIIKQDDCTSSALNRDFLEAVRDRQTSQFYHFVADELAAEMRRAFTYIVINRSEERQLIHRERDGLHRFILQGSGDTRAVEFLLTQQEVDRIYEDANEQIIEWLELDMMDGEPSKKAANHNLAVLSGVASINPR